MDRLRLVPLREFIRLGEIEGETVVINTCDGARGQVREMSDLGKQPNQRPTKTNSKFNSMTPSGQPWRKCRIFFRKRIRNSEQDAQEERRALPRLSSVTTSWSENTRTVTARSLLTRPCVKPATALLPVPQLRR
jgi:hypothetical protein